MSGGVASNAIIRQKLIQSVELHSLYFSKPKYSRDNAYGVAALSWLRGGEFKC
jgi:tRNA A37 threonylcarbamoyltransferase TsaD